MLVPDLWQHEAIKHLREGRDVIVDAPTGAGKTLIFELWAKEGRNRGQAVYTVPTRALANDKRAEWQAKGWDVGITTGDLSENLNAPVIVATLEAQKNRVLRGEGPKLLVIDEYQMIGSSDRGLNYELTIAQVPAATQLLLLSGSVSNPHHIERWLRRLGREAATISHSQRPVPLEEVFPMHFRYHLPRNIKTFWPRMMAQALAEDLGPILIFAPRRAAAESLAGELARQLPNPNPLDLTEEQLHLVDDSLARMLQSRVAFHHSGLSYATRAGVIEPLAKAGQLRIVVATMGLAAGINFSLRSVALAADSYRKAHLEHTLTPDEILQMLGRAGRRGIDETGYVLITPNQIRLRDGFPVDLTRSRLIDWSALLSIMAAATESGDCPFAAAVRVQERLFTTKPIFLGVETSLAYPDVPCHLTTDSERARLSQSTVTEFRNSLGKWEPLSKPVKRPLSEIVIPPVPFPEDENAAPQLIPLLSSPLVNDLFKEGQPICLNPDDPTPVYGRTLKVADRLPHNRIQLPKTIRRLTNWKGRYVNHRRWEEKLVPLIKTSYLKRHTPVIRWQETNESISIVISLAQQTMDAIVDQQGVALWDPERRQAAAPVCRQCTHVKLCRELPSATGTALLWRRLNLIDHEGHPSLRGRMMSFFSHGEGLAIAAAVEDNAYPLEDLIYDLANLDGGFRFAGEENRWTGKLADVCRRTFGPMNIAGYLENGIPLNYGYGASQIVRLVHKNHQAKQRWTTDLLGIGDIDRIIIEWRSRIRQISQAPPLPLDRWTRLQQLAKSKLNETSSPTDLTLPKLPPHQKQRVNHRLYPSQFKHQAT